MTLLHLNRGQTRGLRGRWNRAFALLTAAVLLSGSGVLIGTAVLVDRFRAAATHVEQQATISATLRGDLVSHSTVLLAVPTSGQHRQVEVAQERVRKDYDDYLSAVTTDQARGLVRSSRERWEAMIARAGMPGDQAALVVAGEVVRVEIPEVFAMLDQADSANRAALRSQLAATTRLNRVVMAVLVVLSFLSLVLVLRLARRLSTEVLRPVTSLRDAAGHLADGDLDHRVSVDRDDELGQLAVSFNAMADAVAISQRGLALEASTDALSGLANRAAFRARLQSALTRPEPPGETQTVIVVDVDDFKRVNDTSGHAAGDEVLRVVASRLQAVVRSSDLVGRLGGDEFAILLERSSEAGYADVVAARIVESLAEPVRTEHGLVRTGASVGLASRRERTTVDSWLREADLAMYAAKSKGKSRAERYDVNMDEATTARDALRVDLGRAAEGQLVVEYQPFVDLGTGRILGLEALVRWQHPVLGLLPPSVFIELAEQTGDITAIGAWVLETASRQLQQWQRRYGRPELWMSVNVSVRQLERPGFAEAVMRVLDSTGLNPATLVLEVTESVLADPAGGTRRALEELRASGVRVALDDFGTGFSSIGYLRQLPVDIIKIDRSFVIDSWTDSQGALLLEAIVAMAQHLGLDVIPEGIEEIDQLTRLRAMGCDMGQGFLMARPSPVAAIDELLSSGQPLAHVALASPGPLSRLAEQRTT